MVNSDPIDDNSGNSPEGGANGEDIKRDGQVAGSTGSAENGQGGEKGAIDPEKAKEDLKEALGIIRNNAEFTGKEWGFTIVRNKETGKYEAVNICMGDENGFLPNESNIDLDKYEICGIAHTHKDKPVEPLDFNWFVLKDQYQPGVSNQYIIIATNPDPKKDTYAIIEDRKQFNIWYKSNYTDNNNFILFDIGKPRVSDGLDYKTYYNNFKSRLNGSGVRYGKFR